MTKYSAQRDLIKNNVLHRFDHPTAETVYFSVREKSPRISLATVYRHLENFVKNGLIRKFVVPGEPDHYDATIDEHVHAYCQDCGRIFDINIKLSRLLKRQLAISGGIEINDYQLIASGKCKKCDKKTNERRTYERS